MTNEEQLHPRVARVRMTTAREILRHLDRLEVLFEDVAEDLSHQDLTFDELKTATLTALDRYEQIAHQRIEPRRRLGTHRDWSKSKTERNHYYLFLDECGHHAPNVDPNFPIFCVCGVIVHANEYDHLDREWRDWKLEYLGDANSIVHEPDVRKRTRNFYREDPESQRVLLESLHEQIQKLDFRVIVAGIDKQRFLQQFPDGAVDQFLPAGHYLMCIDFIMERFAHFLWHVGDHARGTIYAESRGQVEDVWVQRELTILHLRGTQFMPARDFRYLIAPAVQFKSKAHCFSGLEVADLLARPAAELIRDPECQPQHSDILIERLYDGLQGRPESYGFKMLPARDLSSLFGA